MKFFVLTFFFHINFIQNRALKDDNKDQIGKYLTYYHTSDELLK